jgi:E3 ubiquitin-protein ligase TRIP12
VAYHPGRRAPYADILNDTNYHHVSPAYAKRFQKSDETEDQYVQRLKEELEEMFQSIGGDSVIACEALGRNVHLQMY